MPRRVDTGKSVTRLLGQPIEYRTLALHAHQQQCTSASSVHDTRGVLDTHEYTRAHRNTLVRFLEYRVRVTLLAAACASTLLAWVLSLDRHSLRCC